MRRAFHPWLLGLFPILHLFSSNLGGFRAGEVAPSVAISLAVTTLLFGAARLLFEDPRRAAAATAVCLLPLYGYGHLALMFDERGLARWNGALLALLVATAVLVVVRLRRGSGDLSAMTRALNLMALALLILPVFAIVAYRLEGGGVGAREILELSERPRRAEQVASSSSVPDIYYIVTDGYPSNGYMAREWGYDNTPFTSALERLGFFVAYDSQANYGATLLSLASTLNMRYLDSNEAPGELGRPTADLLYLRALIADSAVARRLVERGYTYLFVMSGYLLPSSIADLNIDFTPAGTREYDFRSAVQGLGERELRALAEGQFSRRSFYRFMVDTSMLRLASRWLRPLIARDDQPYAWSDTERFFATLERVEAIPAMPEATFSFIHLVEPHGPVQLARNGSPLPRSTWRPTPGQFFAELQLVNERLLLTIETILRRSPTPPIILLQADHGTTLGRVWTDDGHLTHFDILNAYHLPGGPPARLTRDISPINSFRLLLDEYFDVELDDLEVRLFDLPRGYEAPFEQVEVTERFLSLRDNVD